MTDWYSATVLAFVQGATEFLPISSSAHLILLPNLFGWTDQGLAFDIAVHVGTLLATLIYFRHDLLRIISAWLASLFKNAPSQDARLGWMIIIASIPVAVAGLIFHNLVEEYLRSTLVIASATLLFGLWLWYSDRYRRGNKNVDSLSYADAALIGCAQALALIPGTSRSGVTITMGLMLGLTRRDATRFAFLLAIPAIFMAGGWQFMSLAVSDNSVDWLQIAYIAAVAGGVAFLVIHWLLKVVEKIGMVPFVIYRILLAGILFGVEFVI